MLLFVPLSLLLISANLGGRDLRAPDETRAAAIVGAVVQEGRWLTPGADEAPASPPLYHWLASAAAISGGRVDAFTLRLPSSLAALGVILILFHLGRDLFGRRTGALAAIVLATAFGFFVDARWARPQMLWTCLLLLAAYAFHRAHGSGEAGRWMGLAGLAAGLATLAGGVAGLLIPVMSCLAFLAARRDPGPLRGSGWGLFGAIGLLPPALWILVSGLSGGEPAGPLASLAGDVRTVGIPGDAGPGFVGAAMGSAIAFLPWLILLPGAILHILPRRGTRADPSVLYVMAWGPILLAAVFLPVAGPASSGLPLLPWLALIVARLWDTALYGWDPSPVGRIVRWSVACGVLAVLGGVSWYVSGESSEAMRPLRPIILIALCTAAGAMAAAGSGRHGAALGVLAAGSAIVYLLAAAQGLPSLEPARSARAASRHEIPIENVAPPGVNPGSLRT